MRPLLSAFAGFALFTGAVLPAPPPGATGIVGEYVTAAGGAKAISKIRSLAIEGTFTNASDGKSGTFTFNTRAPNYYYSELIADDKSWAEAYNGKSAWHETGSGDVATCLEQESSQLEAAAQYYNGRLLDLKKNGIRLSLVGHTPVRGKDTWEMEVTAANGVKRQVYFDTATHLIAEEKGAACGVEEAKLYSDYRAVNGVMVPYRIELLRGGRTYGITVTRAEINGVMGESVFDFPKKAQVQLPDLKALFQKIGENQKAIHAIRENYCGTRTEETTEYDGGGKAKKTEARQYTFFYMDGEEVSTLVQKDGKPLAEEEQKKENNKARERIEALQRHDAKKEARKEKDEEQGKEEAHSGGPGIEVFLRACQFVNPRRERFRGRDALVFDFQPNPGFTPHTLEERVVQKLAGVLWIDEKALQIARLRAYFASEMKIGGGVLADVQKGTSVVSEQAFVNNEVWLPTYEEANVGARVLLMKSLKVHESTRYSDYKKFDVQTSEGAAVVIRR